MRKSFVSLAGVIWGRGRTGSRDYSLLTLRVVVYVTPAGLMKGRVGDLLAMFIVEWKKTLPMVFLPHKLKVEFRLYAIDFEQLDHNEY